MEIAKLFPHRTFFVYVTPILNPAVTPCCSLQKSTGLFAYRSRPSGKGLTSTKGRNIRSFANAKVKFISERLQFFRLLEEVVVQVADHFRKFLTVNHKTDVYKRCAL